MKKQKSRSHKRYIRKRLKAFLNEKLLTSTEKMLQIAREGTEYAFENFKKKTF